MFTTHNKKLTYWKVLKNKEQVVIINIGYYQYIEFYYTFLFELKKEIMKSGDLLSLKNY